MRKLGAFLLFVPLLCAAATKHYDPDCANNGDGSASSCAVSDGAAGAYNTLTNAAANLNASDTMALHGGTYRQTLVVLDDALTINLDSDAVIDGSDIDPGTGWTLANGEYSKSFATGPEVVVYNGQILNPSAVGSLQTGEWGCSPANSSSSQKPYACSGSSGPWTVYLKDDPSAHTLLIGQRAFGIQLSDVACSVGIPTVTVNGGTIRYQGARFSGVQTSGVGVGAAYISCTNADWDTGVWTVNGTTFVGQSQSALQAHKYNDTTASAPDAVTVTGIRAYDQGGEILYIKGQPDAVVISGNHLGGGEGKTGWNGLGASCDAFDGDAIDVGGNAGNISANITISGNYIHDVGGNGIIWGQGDGTITGNVIENVNNTNDNCDQAGIYIDGNKNGTGGTPAITATGNYIDTANAHGFYISGASADRPIVTIGSGRIRLLDTTHSHIYKATAASDLIMTNAILRYGTYGVRWVSGNPVQDSVKNVRFEDVSMPFYMSPTTSSGADVDNNSLCQWDSLLVGNSSYTDIATMETAQSTFDGNASISCGVPPYGYTLRPNKRVRRSP